MEAADEDTLDDVYKDFADKFSLPPLSTMDKEFEITTIEEPDFLLRNIRIKVEDKIDSATKFFDSLLHPDAGFAAYRESNVFDEKDRDAIISLYKRLMFFKRSATELDFEDSDELNAKFIRDFMVAWPEMRVQLLGYIRRLKDSWQKDISKKEVVRYLG